MTGQPTDPARRYCVQAGPVISKSDGDMHRIGVGALIRLYGLQKGQYMIHRDMNPSACDGLEHLGPRYDGEYPDLSVPSVREHPTGALAKLDDQRVEDEYVDGIFIEKEF